MKFDSQIYLECYNNLHSPQASKKANKTLLQIYESNQAWKIAQELMLSENHIIHGSQLLSQKLNSVLPSQINPQVLAQFILSVKTITNLHWLCLAKLFIHTHQSLHQLQIQGSLGTDIKLNILKEIPHAMSQIRIEFGVKSSEYKTQVYRQNQNLILEAIRFLTENKNKLTPEIEKIQDLVFEVLESFTQCDVKLNCEQIASFVLQFSNSDRISNLFQHIFLQQKYPNLDDRVEEFLKSNLNNYEKDWIKAFYLNFYSKRDIFKSFSLQKYSEVIRTATIMMSTNQQEQFRSILSDSYDFWLSLIINISAFSHDRQISNQLNHKLTLLKENLFVIFEELCKHSRLKKCPSTIKCRESNLDIIDLDSEQCILESKTSNNFQDEFSELNYNVNQIREMSMDLLIKIQEGLKTDIVLYRKIFQSLFILSSSQESHQALQLAIFIVDGMTDCCDEISKPYLSDLIKVILDQKSMQNEYICQRIVILLGKIDKIIVSKVTVLPSVFQFFSNSIAYEKLSSLASESFTDLMDQYEAKNFVVDQEFKEKSETYLNFWFQTFYGKIKTDKVIQNITKALVIFIYKFKGSEYYQQFFIMMNDKIKGQNDESLKDIYLEAVMTGQNWINSRQNKEKQPYIIAFSQFMDNFIDRLLNQCFQANRKPDFTKAIGKINWALKAGCYYTKIQKWLEAIKRILNKSLFECQGDILTISLTPLITLMRSQHLNYKHLYPLCQALQTIINPVTQLFINYHQARSSLDYNFSKYVLQLHNLTVVLILKHPEISQNGLLNYNPTPIFTFVKEKIYKNKTFWEYQVYKETLIFLHQLILSNFQLEEICFEVLGICGRTLESLWIQTQNIFMGIYKKLGIKPFVDSLEKIKPEVLAPNPLFNLLEQGLQKSDRKSLKSFVRCL